MVTPTTSAATSQTKTAGPPGGRLWWRRAAVGERVGGHRRGAAGGVVGGRRRSPLRVGAALLAVVLTAAVAVWAFASQQQQTAVVAAARPITAGTVVSEADLSQAAISAADSGFSGMRWSARGSTVVGQAATTTIPRGALVTQEMLGAGVALPAGVFAVGMKIPAGQMPTQVGPGALVDVAVVPGPSGSGASGSAAGGSGSAGSVLVQRVRVLSVQEDVTTPGAMLVSVAVPAKEAPAAAAAGASGQASLMLQGS